MATTEELRQRWNLPGTRTNGNIGAAIASAGTIAVTHPVHHITGTTEIDTITPPYDGFSGLLCLIADGAFDLGDDGNIFLECLGIVAGQAVLLWYEPVTAKWYPVRTAAA